MIQISFGRYFMNSWPEEEDRLINKEQYNEVSIIIECKCREKRLGLVTAVFSAP